ncbi:histidine phosphatase superfamily [Flagelloscypha sp. PMI_526]|nr:histidine phosphatase superfamily [Flagelloscypha sp. PMI_526]
MLYIVLAFWISLLVFSTTANTQDTDNPTVIPKLSGSPMGVTSPPNPPIYRPPQVPLDVEHYPVAPANLSLEQVHIYVRHGERTPVGIRLADAPGNIPANWLMCRTARQFKAAVVGSVPSPSQNLEDSNFLLTQKVVERPDGSNVEGECLLGELTDVGRQSTYHYGLGLRRLYVDRLGFLPDFLDKKNLTTNMPRTTESLQQIVHGLYPNTKYSPANLPPILVSCKRLELLKLGFAQAAATAYNPTLEPLDKRISKYIGGNPIRIDGKPRASGILDTIRGRNSTRKAADGYYHKTEEVRRLGMGRLLDDMSRKMQSKAEHGSADPLKILVHSTHDTALAGLALFKKTDQPSNVSYLQYLVSPFQKQKDEFFVRLRYQNKNLALPICADDGKHLPGSPEFCTLQAFVSRVKELTPKNFEDECQPPRPATP